VITEIRKRLYHTHHNINPNRFLVKLFSSFFFQLVMSLSLQPLWNALVPLMIFNLHTVLVS